MAENKMDWRRLLGEGLISLVFALVLATAGSTAAYLMLASLAERDSGILFGMTYTAAAPRLAAAVYGGFFLIAILALTRLRVYEQVTARPRLHWLLAFVFFGLIGLAPGLVFWLLFAAADRPGI